MLLWIFFIVFQTNHWFCHKLIYSIYLQFWQKNTGWENYDNSCCVLGYLSMFFLAYICKKVQGRFCKRNSIRHKGQFLLATQNATDVFTFFIYTTHSGRILSGSRIWIFILWFFFYFVFWKHKICYLIVHPFESLVCIDFNYRTRPPRKRC